MDQIFRFLGMGLSTFETIAIWAVLLIAFIGLGYALFLRRQILAEDKGTARMQEVWEAIRQGANAYLGRQLRTILPFIAVLTVALFLSVYIVPPTEFSREVFAGYSEGTIRLIVGLGRAIAFVMGAGFSLAVGQIGMRMAVEGNVRVAQASRTSFKDALRIAYRTGTITGMLTDGLGLLGGTIIFMIFANAAPDALLGFVLAAGDVLGGAERAAVHHEHVARFDLRRVVVARGSGLRGGLGSGVGVA